MTTFQGFINDEEGVGDHRWRTSLRKSKVPVENLSELRNYRAVATDNVRKDLFSFKPVSLSYLNNFWRQIRTNVRASSVEIYSVIIDIPELKLRKGQSLFKEHEEDDRLRCRDPLTGEYYTVSKAGQVQKKESKLWTIQEVCWADIIPFTKLTNSPMVEKEDTGAGMPFSGTFVLASHDCIFQDMLLALRDQVKAKGIGNDEMSFFWIDLFCVNFSLLRKCQTEPMEVQREVYETYVKSSEQAMNLFEQRFIYFTDWNRPNVLNNTWTVYQMYKMFSNNNKFKIFVQADIFTKFIEVYDRSDPGISKVIKNMDPSRLKFEFEYIRTRLVSEMTNHPEGFLTVIKLLGKKLERSYVKDVQDDVKKFPEPNDQVSMEKLAILLYKTGNYMRKHHELAVAKSYLARSLEIYRSLQKLQEDANKARTQFDEITLKEQVGQDRVNGGASRVLLFQALIALEEKQSEQTRMLLNLSEVEARKIHTQKAAFLTDVSEGRAEMHAFNGNVKGAINELIAMTLVLDDAKNALTGSDRCADVFLTLSVKQREVGDFDGCKKSLLRAKEIKTQVFGAASFECSVVVHELGVFYYKLKDDSAAIQCFLEAIERFKVCRGTVNEELATAYKSVAQAYARSGGANAEMLTTALTYYRLATETFSLATGKFTLSTATTMGFEGVILKQLGRLEDAEDVFKRSIECIEEERKLQDELLHHLSKHELETRAAMLANAYSNLGQTQELSNRFFHAKKCFQKSYEITKEIVGESNPKTVQRLQRWRNAEKLAELAVVSTPQEDVT